MKQPSIFAHLRDILILPGTVTLLIPYLAFNPSQHFIPDHPVVKIAGLLIITVGFGLWLSTVLLFKNTGGGTLAPWAPTQNLVIAGPYRYCRNPMISGVIFILSGEAMVFHSTNMLIWAGLFFIINMIYIVFIEEPSLLKRFGETYARYRKNVPMWIPKLQAPE